MKIFTNFMRRKYVCISKFICSKMDEFAKKLIYLLLWFWDQYHPNIFDKKSEISEVKDYWFYVQSNSPSINLKREFAWDF